MEQLASALQSVSRKTRQLILCNSFVFPKTEKLKDDKPCITYDADTLDIPAIKRYINSHPEAIALSVRTDLSLILDVINEVKEELWLSNFDCIQIYRGGIDILRINLKQTEPRGRSAFVEINGSRRLQEALITPWSSALMSAVVTGLILTAAQVLLSRLRFK